MPTSINRNSKPDTVFLCLPEAAGLAACAVDVSQKRTDLTSGTNTVSEANSDRTALTCPREVTVVVDLTNAETANLVEHGADANSANYTWRLRAAAGTILAQENGSTRVSLTVPNPSGSAQKFLIHWSVRREGTSVRSELYVRNMATGGEAHAQATHAEATTSATHDTFAINSSLKLAAMTRFYAVRVGRRFHSTAEAREDWVTETTPPTMTQVRRAAPLVPDRATLDIASDGSFAGPAYLWSACVFEQADRRLVGPLVNLRVHDPLRITVNYLPAAWWRTAPGDAAVRLCEALLFYRPVPLKVNRARVRLFVRQVIEIGDDTAPVRYRCYSLAGLPVVGEPVGPLVYHRTAAATCDTNHASGQGEWLDLGALPLAIDADGFTWLAVGVEIDETDPGLAADSSAYVVAVTIEPYFEAPDGGALDFADP